MRRSGTPRWLLVEHDRNLTVAPAADPVERAPTTPPRRRHAGRAIALPAGFVTGGNFEGEER